MSERQMTRSEKLKWNTVTSLINQTVTLVCGFILSRYILTCFGSAQNGLISSIGQFLGLISFCELGVGAVVQSTLYKPLADEDNSAVSRVMVSANRFFNRIGMILAIYVAVLLATYPFIYLDRFGYMSTATLIVTMAITYFAQYFFGIKNQILLNADQRSYVGLLLQSSTTVLNTAVSICIMSAGASIQTVKLVTSLIFLLRPLGLTIYVKKKYRIDYNIKLGGEPIEQKWNGLAQHMAAVVLGNTDTVVLSLCSTLANVSVYNVYFMVVNGVKQIVTSATTGIQAMFGNMLAKNEREALDLSFGTVEWILHTATVLIFTVTGLLIIPFVRIYTYGITDADYIVPNFSVLIVAATGAYCIRLPYSMMVLAAGHYKETQTSAIIEMVLNIIISVVAVFRFGLIGVAIGTLVSMSYRTVYFVMYLKKNIICRGLNHFIKHMAVDVLTVAAIIMSVYRFSLSDISYLAWIILAVKTFTVAFAITLLINLLCYKRETLGCIKAVLRIK